MPRKEANFTEKKAYVGIKNYILITLQQLGYTDINSAIEDLITEIQKKDAKIIERDSVIEKLANGIEILSNLLNKENVSESDIVSAQNELKDLQLVLQQHLEYLNQAKK
jgi:hypothetical protein